MRLIFDLSFLVSSQKMWVNLSKPDRFWKPVRFFPDNLEKIPFLHTIYLNLSGDAVDFRLILAYIQSL